MRQIASLEISILVKELQGIVGSRVEKFYDIGNGSFRFTLYGNGSHTMLYIMLLHTINMTRYAEEVGEATDFAMAIRKRITGATVTAISQYRSDRIAVLGFSGREEYRLVIEMFGKGNLALLDSNGKVLASYRQVRQKDRSVVPNSMYVFPESSTYGLSEINDALAREIARDSTDGEEKLIAKLSARLGLGPMYVEEIIRDAGIDPKQKASAAKGSVDALASSIVRFAALAQRPQPVAYKKGNAFVDYAALPLKKYDGYETVKYSSISELLDEYYLSERSAKLSSSASTGIGEIVSSIRKQKELVEELEKEAADYAKAGNIIFSNMAKINELIAFARANKKADLKSLQEKFPELKIKSIDLAKKEIIIEL